MLLPTGPGPMEAVMSNTFTKTLCRVSRGNLAVLLWVSLAPWAGHAQERTDESAAELSRSEVSYVKYIYQNTLSCFERKPCGLTVGVTCALGRSRAGKDG